MRIKTFLSHPRVHHTFRFLQRLSTFFNGSPLSSKVFQFSLTAFQFSSTDFLFSRNPRKSIYGGKYTKDHHSSFVLSATCSPSFVITTRSPSFVIATRSPSFVIATRSPSFIIATMHASHPTKPISKNRDVFFRIFSCKLFHLVLQVIHVIINVFCIQHSGLETM